MSMQADPMHELVEALLAYLREEIDELQARCTQLHQEARRLQATGPAVKSLESELEERMLA